jgi:AraC-like DNA-binding protein
VTGSDRFTLARHFCRAFGTSPDRYRMLRHLALARQAVERGDPLVQVAARAGFADQSHLNPTAQACLRRDPGALGCAHRVPRADAILSRPTGPPLAAMRRGSSLRHRRASVLDLLLCRKGVAPEAASEAASRAGWSVCGAS